MRFVLMHKNDPKSEAGLPPDAELVQKMGAFIGEHMKAGRFLDGAGLRGSSFRTRLRFRDGRATVQHGPYRGEHELPAVILLLEVRTREEALGWAERYGKVLGDGELEVGKVTEPWDIGVAPEPTDAPLHFLLIEKEGGERTAKQKSELSRLRTEMTKAGVLQRGYGLQPSTKAKRLTFVNNDLSVVDGPFAESKELVGGLSVMELSGFDEAIALCRPYAQILGGNLEIDLRLVADDEG